MSTMETTTAYRPETTAAQPRRPRLVVIGAVVVALLAAAFAVKALTGDDQKKGELKGSAGNETFKLNYPDGWRALAKDKLRSLPGKPLAVVRRNDGKGFVVLRREGRAPTSFDKFSGDLTRALDKRVPDFQKQSSRIVEIRAGKAFFYSYIRKTKGTVHTVVVVPAGDKSYALNTVSQGGSEKVARETARIILSFDL
jgi:hypothetical protein